MFNLDNVTVRTEPFTAFYLRGLLPPDFYEQLAHSFPPLARFSFRANLGNKYLLTESEGDAYFEFVESSPPWRKFYDEIKSDDFKQQVLSFLNSNGIDAVGNGASVNDLTARFEFSALPTNGGSQRPHTDNPEKLVTLILSLMKAGEWDPRWGGGTSICRPKDETLYFNYANDYLDFADVEIVDAFPFEPNAGVVFVKTPVSWHCVQPLNVAEASPLRKTVAISLFRETNAAALVDDRSGN
jgi:hypothetical protein